jgi:hypothetical protein
MPRSMVYDVDVNDVPAAEMYRQFTTRRYWEDLVDFYRGNGSRTEISHFWTGESGTDVSFAHIMSGDDLPAVARPVLPGTFVVTREQHFDAFHVPTNRAAGRYRAHIPAPVEVTGDYLLLDTDRGSRMRLESVCRVPVPFIGGKIEQLVMGGLKALFAQEGKFTATWIAGNH